MTAVPMRPVASSHIDAIGYDEASGELHVKYKSGRTAVYAVDQRTALDVMTAPSIGKALHETVRSRYPHRYLNGEDNET